ncbi:MAG: hypothetical protein IKJ65_03865 [Clostridia bacterium]|nr:hypothetical protein [Clostridia bacterium]
MEHMTEMSRMMFIRAKDPMNIQDAVSLLEEGAKFRSFRDKLDAFSYGRDLRPLLTNGLLANHPEAKFDAVDKKVRNWLNGRTQSVSKQDAFELAFIMKLSLEDADRFISMVTEEGIHWRDVKELVFGYALSKGMSFPEAESLYERMPKETGKESENAGASTSLIKDDVLSIADESALIAYAEKAINELGKFHNTAYNLFMEYMEMLENAGIVDGLIEEKSMSVRDVLDSYLYRQTVPAGAKGKKDAMTDAQKFIRADWPDETTLSRMKSRQTDVTRKVLILLFLATNGGDAEEDYDFDDDEDLTRDEIFADAVSRLNLMLSSSGFMKLDPRNRFDWMVMYSMCVEDIFDVDERFSSFLSELYASGN